MSKWDIDPAEIDFPVFVELFNSAQGNQTTRPQFRMAEWMQDTDAATRRMLLAYRSSGKSHIAALYVPWRLRREPEWTVIYCSAQLQPIATRQAIFIRSVIENFWVCDGMKPDPNSSAVWQQYNFCINRPILDGTPSVQITSIDSGWTGLHSHSLIGDDCEIEENCRSEDEREFLWSRIGSLAAICNNHFYIGTPHAVDTIYDKLRDANPTRLQSLKIPVMDTDGNPANPDVPIFGVVHDEEWIDTQRNAKSEAWFNSQFLLIPSDIVKTRFRMENIRLFSDKLEVSNHPLLGIAEWSEHVSRFWIANEPVKDLLAWWDPASGDKAHYRDSSVLAIVATTESGNFYVLDLVDLPPLDLVDDTGSQAQCEAVIAACDAYHLNRVIVESNFNPTLAADLRRTAKIKRRKISIKTSARTSNTNKHKFIANTLDPLIRTGRLYLAEKAADQTQVMKQLREFGPKMRKDDFVDAMASAINELKGAKPKPDREQKAVDNPFQTGAQAYQINRPGSVKL